MDSELADITAQNLVAGLGEDVRMEERSKVKKVFLQVYLKVKQLL